MTQAKTEEEQFLLKDIRRLALARPVAICILALPLE